MIRSKKMRFVVLTAAFYMSMMLVQYLLSGFPEASNSERSSKICPASSESELDAVEAVANSSHDTEQCGTLPPLGTRTIQHPHRIDGDDNDEGPMKLMVSYDDDRVFAVPLDGMTFDLNSKVYIFLHGDNLTDAKVLFKLDQNTIKMSQTGSPFDFMGQYDGNLFGLTKAVPLYTARLGRPRCHTLAVTVVTAVGTSERLSAQFRVVMRKPKVWLIATIGVQDLEHVSHFITHYLSIGIAPQQILITVHAPVDSDTRIQTVTHMLKFHNIQAIYVWYGPFNTYDKFEIQESLARRLVLQQDWVLHPDVDEHQIYPFGDIKTFVDRLDERDLTAVFGIMQDRVTSDGSLAEVKRGIPMEAQFPLVCDVTKSIVGGAVTKLVLHRGFLMAEEGGYHTLFQWKGSFGRNFKRVRRPPFNLAVSHFKWTSGVAPKLAQREATFKKQGIRWWVQSARLRKFIEAHGNKLNVSDSDLRCRPGSDDRAFYNEQTSLSVQAFVPSEINIDDRFTVVLTGHSSLRHSNQVRLLRHFAKMASAHEVIFVWNSQSEPPPAIPEGTLRPIRLVKFDTNSLNNRWNHTLYPRTDAVLMVDDDTFIPLHTIRSLHARWLYEPSRLVGLVGRNFADGEYVYPKACCTTYDTHVKECSKPAQTQKIGVRTRRIGVKCGESTRSMRREVDEDEENDEFESLDTFCDTFRFVLPKVNRF